MISCTKKHNFFELLRGAANSEHFLMPLRCRDSCAEQVESVVLSPVWDALLLAQGGSRPLRSA